MKICTKCLIEKSEAEFSVNRRKKSGLHTQCKACVSIKTAADYVKHKERILARNRTFYAENKTEVLAKQRVYGAAHREQNRLRSKAWYESNKQHAHDVAKKRINSNRAKHAEYVRVWTQRNKDVKAASVAARRAQRANACVIWANATAMRMIYADAEEFRLAGMNVDVDHMVPLISDIVCGLHTEANLRILLSSHNRSKGNRAWPDQP